MFNLLRIEATRIVFIWHVDAAEICLILLDILWRPPMAEKRTVWSVKGVIDHAAADYPSAPLNNAKQPMAKYRRFHTSLESTVESLAVARTDNLIHLLKHTVAVTFRTQATIHRS